MTFSSFLRWKRHQAIYHQGRKLSRCKPTQIFLHSGGFFRVIAIGRRGGRSCTTYSAVRRQRRRGIKTLARGRREGHRRRATAGCGKWMPRDREWPSADRFIPSCFKRGRRRGTGRHKIGGRGEPANATGPIWARPHTAPRPFSPSHTRQ